MTSRPHENCYWIAPRLLMAGEYPAAPAADAARQKLVAIASAGIRHFIDLTQVRDPVPSYKSLLPGVAAATHTQLGYDRFAIPDLGIPDSPDLTNTILDRIDELIAHGTAPYVHCWGGVGRTGTIIGCWLVRHGKSGDEALQTIASHWTSIAKRHRHPRSPETEGQMFYVRQWAKHDSVRLSGE